MFFRLGGLALGLSFTGAGIYYFNKFKQGYGIKLELRWHTMGLVGGLVPPKKASDQDKGNLFFIGLFMIFGAVLFLPGSLGLI
jgi:hypothetical protein